MGISSPLVVSSVIRLIAIILYSLDNRVALLESISLVAIMGLELCLVSRINISVMSLAVELDHYARVS